MVKKHAITMTSLVVTVIIIAILATVITLSISSTINFSRISKWSVEIGYIQDSLDEILKKSSTPQISLGTISINTEELSNEQIEEQFSGETIENSQVELQILDVGALGINNTTYGNKKTEDDVYAYSEITSRVYYVKGIEVDGEIYYTLTNKFFDMFGIEKDDTSLTSIVFVPSKIGYTNEAITVTVKVPNTFTNINITTNNNSIVVGNATTVDNTYEYQVNTTNVAGNYIITVAYTTVGENKTTTYEINGYDNVVPSLEISESLNDSILTNATDNVGIKYLKYFEGKISQDNAKEFFKNNGKKIINSKFNLDSSINKYTVYVEDKAGNFVIKTFDVVKNVWEYKKDSNGKYTLVTNGSQDLGIGDTINYVATGTNYNGQWRILGANSDGELIIVSRENVEDKTLGEVATSNPVKSENDWVHYEEILNEVCKPYGKGYGASKINKARSIKIEDVNKLTGFNVRNIGVYDPDQLVNDGRTYTSYGNQRTYTSGLFYVDGNWINATTQNPVTMTTTSYVYYPKTNTNVGTDPENGLNVNNEQENKIYNMLFTNVNETGHTDNYYYASKYIGAGNTAASWQIMDFKSGIIGGDSLVISLARGFSKTFGVRPVVAIKSNKRIIGDSSSGWNITSGITIT